MIFGNAFLHLVRARTTENRRENTGTHHSRRYTLMHVYNRHIKAMNPITTTNTLQAWHWKSPRMVQFCQIKSTEWKQTRNCVRHAMAHIRGDSLESTENFLCNICHSWLYYGLLYSVVARSRVDRLMEVKSLVFARLSARPQFHSK